MKTKYGKEMLRHYVEQGMTPAEIYKKLNIPVGSQTKVKKRIDEILKEERTNAPVKVGDDTIQLMDTVTHGETWYRVVGTSGDEIHLKEITENNTLYNHAMLKPKKKTVNAADFIAKGYKLKPLPKVKCYKLGEEVDEKTTPVVETTPTQPETLETVQEPEIVANYIPEPTLKEERRAEPQKETYIVENSKLKSIDTILLSASGVKLDKDIKDGFRGLALKLLYEAFNEVGLNA